MTAELDCKSVPSSVLSAQQSLRSESRPVWSERCLSMRDKSSNGLVPCYKTILKALTLQYSGLQAALPARLLLARHRAQKVCSVTGARKVSEEKLLAA